MAARVVAARQRFSGTTKLLAAAVTKRTDAACLTHRCPTSASADFSRRSGGVCSQCRIDGSNAEIEPPTRGESVYDLLCRLGRTALPLHQTRRHHDRHDHRQPPAQGTRAPNRFLCQHPSPACGFEGSAQFCRISPTGTANDIRCLRPSRHPLRTGGQRTPSRTQPESLATVSGDVDYE